jgi:tRNA (guanine-N7-)-methyltransferase
VSHKPDFLARIAERREQLRRDLTALLPAPRPITWEIGSGHGHFLVRYAAEHPGKFCVGVDIQIERIERANKKRDHARLPNCHFVRAEAREVLHALPAGVGLAEVWILFPDPWPKARHNKNRLLKPEFLEDLAVRAGEGTPLYFRTDHTGYFREAEAHFRAARTWAIDSGAPWPMEHETVFQARAPVYHSLVALRTKHPATPTTAVAPGLPPLAAPTSFA